MTTEKTKLWYLKRRKYKMIDEYSEMKETTKGEAE